MGGLDSFVKVGQKFLPPPGVLFITHLLYITLSIILFFIEDLVHEEHSTCRLWIQWLLLGVAIFMTVLVGLAKYKQKNDIIATIISFLLFFATIIGLQAYPFGCSNWVSWGSHHWVYYIVRGAICIPLAIVYTFLCKDDLLSLKPK
ncbi:uncharacterized protein LOC134815953 [Bolinopsis microptera]|uniref:uncharacterized protein LOC134815953 n=1 Tax=Bolinopsis microptera TaxID=2820187 RepID=UPI003079B35A